MHPTLSRKRGSALGAALVLSFSISLILAGLMQWALNEREISMRHIVRAKTQMTAEGVDQYGAAQIKARLEKLTYFADDEFRPEKNPPKAKVTTVVNDALGNTGLGGVGEAVGGLLGGLLGGSNSSNGGGGGNSNANPPPAEDASQTDLQTNGYFRYEITPHDLVVGRFQPARWEKAEAENPFYFGDPLAMSNQIVRVREVRMVSSAKAVDASRQETLMAYCESYLQVRDSPVWGNVLFYNMDLEIAPGPQMDIHGAVHTNGNLYVQSGDSVQFHDIVTAAGHLYHGRAPGGGADAEGGVAFKKAGTTSEFVSLKQNGAWLDSRSSAWTAQASTLWAGAVRSREHGINPAIPAGMAPYTPDDPSTPADELENSAHVLIEPAMPSTDAAFPGNEIETQKFASKACLVFEVGTSGSVELYKYEPSNSGTYVRDVGLGPQKFVRRQLTVPTGLVVGDSATDKFYDRRRAQWVKSLDLDVGRLKQLVEVSGQAAGFDRGTVSFDPAKEWNGIVYVSHAHTSRGGVRLVNGSSIPDRPTSYNGNTAGFTLGTDAPLYIAGNYNADGVISSDGDQIRAPDSSSEPPAGLAADAVTILSQGWLDENSDKGLSSRRAQQTEVAVALITGIVPTNKNRNGAYSGGVENLPRFLEDWSGIKLGYRGSMVVLYESQRAVEPWGSSSVYNPPNRVWGFNKLFAEGILPPGTPNSRTYRRVGFRDLSPADYEQAMIEINGQ